MKYLVHNNSSGHVFGVFKAEDEIHAIAAMLRDAGYKVTIEDDKIVFPRGTPDAVSNLRRVVADEWHPQISVNQTLDAGGIGGGNDEWRERVRFECEQQIVEALTESFPDSEINVDVTIGTESKLVVEIDAEDYDTSEAIKDIVKHASDAGWNKACAGG